MGKYVEDGYQALREDELVAENEQLHELAGQLEADADPDSMAPSYNFRSLLDTLAHRGKADLINHRHSTHDWKAMTWANSQHSPECGSWLKGRSNDFYPFPNSHTYYINALSLLMSSPGEGQPFYCPCNAKINIRSDPWHCLDCPHSNPVRTRCHTKILDALQHTLQTVGEVKGSPRLMKRGKYIFADLQFCRKSDNALYYIDASTVNPAAPKYMKTGGSQTQDHASSIREMEKITQYEGVDSLPHNRIVPFVIECTGRLGKAARDFLKEVGLDDKKRSALKNELASIIAFANGECISTSYLKGSTRAPGLMVNDDEDADASCYLGSELSATQQQKRVGGYKSDRQDAKEPGMARALPLQQKTTGGAGPVIPHTGSQPDQLAPAQGLDGHRPHSDDLPISLIQKILEMPSVVSPATKNTLSTGGKNADSNNIERLLGDGALQNDEVGAPTVATLMAGSPHTAMKATTSPTRGINDKLHTPHGLTSADPTPFSNAMNPESGGTGVETPLAIPDVPKLKSPPGDGADGGAGSRVE